MLIETGNDPATARLYAIAECEVITLTGGALCGHTTASTSSTATVHIHSSNSVSTVTRVGTIEPVRFGFLRGDREEGRETQ
jgi:hypothetical protein